MKFVKYIVALSLLAFFVSLTYLYTQTLPVGGDKKIVHEVYSGSLRSHLQYLQKEGILKNALITEILARLITRTIVQKGEYEFTSSMSAPEILRVLASGKSVSRPITFKEGINIFEMASIIQDKGLATKEEFLKKVQDPKLIQELLGENHKSLEGYLYPETYYYQKNMPIEILIRAQVRQFFTVLSEVAPEWQGDKKKLHTMTTLASMVEKETGAEEERSTIASVFYNRLKKGMKLQSDPTIIYGIAMERGALINNIRKSDILHPSDFNTYYIRGLPLSPIANPGKEALEAVKNPAQTDYLYFVSMNEGRHYFSKTYEEHNKAVKEYQMNRKARQGKSWRNLKSNK